MKLILLRPENWLLFGDLLCISIDGSFQEPVWAVVEKHIAQEAKSGLVIIIFVCSLPLFTCS